MFRQCFDEKKLGKNFCPPERIYFDSSKLDSSFKILYLQNEIVDKEDNKISCQKRPDDSQQKIWKLQTS